jgi:hypothetical protein
MRELRALIHAGRLFDVQAWLEAGKPFRTNRTSFIRSEPCVVAVKTGFFGMVECFLRQELTQPELNAMLAAAVPMHRPHLVELLLKSGADVHSIYFREVLDQWQPEVIRVFLRYGADYKTGSPFAEAFVDGVRTSIGIFKSLLKKEPELISQANEALVEHVKMNDKKWVELMLWLGADPRAEVPGWLDEPTTALIEAARYGRLDSLKRFKVDPKRDDLIELICAPAAYIDLPQTIPLDYGAEMEAALRAQPEIEESMEYLLSFNPDLHSPTKSGRSIMETFFYQMWMECAGFPSNSYPSRLMEYILCLAKHGLQWTGENPLCPLTLLKKVLRTLEKDDQWKLLLGISTARALTPKALMALISTSALRDLLNADPIKASTIREAAVIRSPNMTIVNWVRDGVSRASEIAAKTGISEGAVNRRAARLIKTGRLTRKRRGMYNLGPNSSWFEEDLERF